MPERCDICGITALERQQFVEERLPLLRARRYCPACHAKFCHRVFLSALILLLLAAAIGFYEVLRRDKGDLDSSNLWLIFLFLIQWIMIVPHELGHALAARVFGPTHIRILVGFGKPMFTFDFLGFSWLFNPLPFVGLTLSKIPARAARWKYLAFFA